MDRSWMNANRASKEYADGVEFFINFAKVNQIESSDKFLCPCTKCKNGRRHEADTIKEHLIFNGISNHYTVWTWHGEVFDIPSETTKQADGQHTRANVDDGFEVEDRFEDMIRDVGQESFQEAHVHDILKSDAEKALFPGCKNFTRLSATLSLVNIKAKNGWTDKSFTELLEQLKLMFPDCTLPSRHYEAKKILCPMGMEYKKIHACRNDCILYRKEYESSDKCPTCGEARYKERSGECGTDENTRRRAPVKAVWYLPIIPRFRRLFANAEDAKNLTWHADGRKCDGKIRHPADASQWKKIDRLFPDFGCESRNLRLGLATDGMNPYGNLSSQHSSWPVLLVIYNLPSWLCMKRKFILLSMMISGPKQPGNDIDVYLQLLIEELKKLWEEGIYVFDGCRRETFKLRALLFCTINDFPAYGNLSGYSNKGHLACPICVDNTNYQQLKHGHKTVYTRTRRWLHEFHPYRKLKKAFDGKIEDKFAPTPITGQQVYDRVKDINTIFGKTKKKAREKSIWKKRSIFFDLPYWRHLDVRHCIDVMHVEKNVCDSLIGTLLDIKGKTKDNAQARQDLAHMGIRPHLHPVPSGDKVYLPPACHTLSREEKKKFCQSLRDVKVPQGYSSNIKSLVSMQDLKLVGLKSHDCHVLMQQLLAVAVRDILPKKVRHAIIRLSYFFNDICTKVVDPSKLDEWEREAAVILCQLEMYFPPSFFDIMVHLIVHLVNEIRECGPVYLRWMYPIERYMKILKGYTKNPARPEASIVERYIAEEAIEFCTDYMAHVQGVGLPKSRHDGRYEGKGTRGVAIQTKSFEEVLQAHLYILNNTEEVIPYLADHKKIVKTNNPRMTEKDVLKEHNKTFLSWFHKQIVDSKTASEMLIRLAHGPKKDVITWCGYDINNLSFYTKSQDDKGVYQNCGVTLEAEAMHFSSSKDKNPVKASINYFGFIEEIWEVDYVEFRVPVFKCKWADINTGVQIDETRATLVNLHTATFTDEPFIMACQAKQVFYVKDQCNENLSVALKHDRSMDVTHENEDPPLDNSESLSFTTRMPFIEEAIVDDEYANRQDHNEGIWEKLEKNTS